MHIPESRIEEALKKLAETDERFGSLKAEDKRAERRIKSTIALAKKASNQTSQAAKETEAYASEDYSLAVEDAFRVARDLEVLRAQRDREHLVIEVWRTLEASRRKA